MSQQHTPSPWTYSPQSGTPGHCTLAQVWRPDGKSLTDLEPTADEAEATANARLIASAPDMLQALLAAQQCIRDMVEAYRNDCARFVLDEAVKSLRDDAGKLVDAALKKATDATQ